MSRFPTLSALRSLLLALPLAAAVGCSGGTEDLPADPGDPQRPNAEATTGGLIVTEVLDERGNLITFYDYDGDGTPNAATVDATGDGPDGDIDSWWFDSDDDGRWDRHVWDTDDDGVPDVGEMDWDGDGEAETFWQDLDGDGQLDPGESIELEERPFYGPDIDDGEVLDIRTIGDDEAIPAFPSEDTPTRGEVNVGNDIGQAPTPPADDCTYGGSQYPYGFEEKCIDGLWNGKTRHWWTCQTAPTDRDTFEWTPTNRPCENEGEVTGAEDEIEIEVGDNPEAVTCEGPVEATQTWVCDETWQLVTEGTLLCSDGSTTDAQDVLDTHTDCEAQGYAVVVDADEAYYDSDTCEDAMLLEESEGYVCIGDVQHYQYAAVYGCADGSLEELGGGELVGDCG